MFHPLIDDPKTYKDQDLENKILELTKKYHIAARSGQGGLCHQILLILDSYKEEQRNRHQKSLRDINKNNNDLDDLINVD